MTEPSAQEQEPEQPPLPDPMKGVRGVFAACLVLEAVIVFLSLLLLPHDGGGATALNVSVITGLGVLMVLASGVQRRPWGLGVALGLQVVMLACGFFVPALAVVAVIFMIVWALLLWLRRDVARKMAAGRLPAQLMRDAGL